MVPMGDATTPLGEASPFPFVGAARSALAELTSCECGGETSESEVEGVLTQRPTSHIPLGWVDGILRPLP